MKQRLLSLPLGLSLLIFATNVLGNPANTVNPVQYQKNAVGIALGAPQTFALTYERSLTSSLSASFHVGSVVLINSTGARVLWRYRQKGFRPYLFAGAVFIHATAEGYGDPEGTSGYIWLGPGISLEFDRWAIYSEVGALLGGDDDRGLGDDWVFPFSPVIAVGMMLYLK